MARKELTVEPRQVTGKKVAQLRRAGVLPANVYGHGLDSVSLQIDAEQLETMVKAASANEVLDLHITGERAARPVVIHHLQRHPLTSGILHADFYQVSLREKMRAEVPIHVVGRSDAIETFNGVLMTGIESLSIEALPLDLPSHFEVDISVLTNLEEAIHVRDIPMPANLTVLNEADVVVVKIASPRVSVEGEEPAAAAEGPVAEGGEEAVAAAEAGAVAEAEAPS